ncbi:type II toxin-antitoxin system VapC family toxin [Nocardioides rotundus]|uniref:type II toxin-antitoxin system VapC family toxin n=1 Tax=Nocardioides rotundus TaxID=1774216 RepID=UPI001CC037CF|nr:type II toxin-antitoxin system VapC family toxin [Nocardioides rotundus]UAL30632.1 type II toxin-antitoxin system VapC family toxin [Nocardioides rotundus]
MLLDTHVVLWLLEDDPRLGPEARASLTEAIAVHVSAASLWEIAIKQSVGKLTVPDDLPARVEAAGLRWLPLGADHVWATRTVEGLPHRNPFDRLLVAQALVEGLPLLTADRALLGAPLEADLLDARR